MGACELLTAPVASSSQLSWCAMPAQSPSGIWKPRKLRPVCTVAFSLCDTTGTEPLYCCALTLISLLMVCPTNHSAHT